MTSTPVRAENPPILGGAALSITSVTSVQFGAALAAHLFGTAGPLGTVTLRLCGAAIVLVAIARPWRRRWTRSELLASAVFGAVFTAMNVSLYLAIDRLPLATVITLEFLGPLAVSIVTASNWATRVWVLPAGLGVAFLGGSLNGSDAVGIGFALGAACCWATYIVLSGRLGRSGTGLAGLSLGCVVGSLIMAPIGAATAGTVLLRPDVLALGLAVGVISSAIPYSLDLLALRRLPTAVFGVLTSLNPGMAALAGLVVLGETVTGPTLVGVGLVMLASIGVTVTVTRSRRRRPVPLGVPQMVRSARVPGTRPTSV
ncbi:MAG: EamA family transporter [Jatrophihabitans sp.]